MWARFSFIPMINPAWKGGGQGVGVWSHSNFCILRYNLLMHPSNLRQEQYHPTFYYNTFSDLFAVGCQCFTCISSLLLSNSTRSPSQSQSIPSPLGSLLKEESTVVSFSRNLLHHINQNVRESEGKKPGCHTRMSKHTTDVQTHYKGGLAKSCCGCQTMLNVCEARTDHQGPHYSSCSKPYAPISTLTRRRVHLRPSLKPQVLLRFWVCQKMVKCLYASSGESWEMCHLCQFLSMEKITHNTEELNRKIGADTNDKCPLQISYEKEFMILINKLFLTIQN